MFTCSGCGTMAGALIGAAVGGRGGAGKGALIGAAVDVLSLGQQPIYQNYNYSPGPTYYEPFYRAPVCYSRPWCDVWGCRMITLCQ